MQAPPSRTAKLIATILVGLVGIGFIFAILDWKRTLGTLLVAAVLAATIASMFFVPAICYFAIATRSIRESFSRSWEMWKYVASEIFSQIN